MKTLTVSVPTNGGALKMTRPTRYYFAYGSNLQVEQFFRRCPAAKRVARCTLPDHELFFDGVADIRPAPGKVVEGAIYEITDRCEHALDKYEGYPNLYTKAQFMVWDGSVRLKVMTYTMKSNRIAKPSPSYEQVIRDGFDDWGIPHDTLDRAVAEARDKAPLPLLAYTDADRAADEAAWAAGGATRRKAAHGLLKARAKGRK